VRFPEVSEYFCSLEAYVTLLPTFMIECKAKFQVEANENKVVILFLSNFTDPVKLIHGPPRDPWTPC